MPTACATRDGVKMEMLFQTSANAGARRTRGAHQAVVDRTWTSRWNCAISQARCSSGVAILRRHVPEFYADVEMYASNC